MNIVLETLGCKEQNQHYNLVGHRNSHWTQPPGTRQKDWPLPLWACVCDTVVFMWASLLSCSLIFTTKLFMCLLSYSASLKWTMASIQNWSRPHWLCQRASIMPGASFSSWERLCLVLLAWLDPWALGPDWFDLCW